MFPPLYVKYLRFIAKYFTCVLVCLIQLPVILRVCFSAFFIFCRVFLLVEAVISLRRVPLGVYASVPWVQAIPHVS